MKKNLMAILFCLFIPIFLYGSDIKPSYWLGAGYGVSAFRGRPPIKQAYASINLRYNNIFYVHARVSGLVDYMESSTGVRRLIDAGLLAGILYDMNQYMQLGLSGGFSYFQCEKPEIITENAVANSIDYQKRRITDKTYRTIGIPIDLQFFILPFKTFGVGASGYANINVVSPYIGGSLIAKLGYLK